MTTLPPWTERQKPDLAPLAEDAHARGHKAAMGQLYSEICQANRIAAALQGMGGASPAEAGMTSPESEEAQRNEAAVLQAALQKEALAKYTEVVRPALSKCRSTSELKRSAEQMVQEFRHNPDLVKMTQLYLNAACSDHAQQRPSVGL